MNTENIAYYGSCSFMCMLGDITLQWDEQNKEKMLELIRKKMDEGYTFFTTKKYMFGKIKRKSEVTKKDLIRGNIKDLIISDEQFEKMVADLDDRDIAKLVVNKNVEVMKAIGKKETQLLKRAKSAEDVIDKDSVAIRPIRGG